MLNNFLTAGYTGTKNYTQQQVQTANASGFGAAADDYSERGIDLNEQLIRNKPATFFFRMNGNAMENAHILPGDILIVDRSIKPTSGKIIVAAVDGELTIRFYQHQFNKQLLVAANKCYKDIELNEYTQYAFWGVVTYVIHCVSCVS
jgi:DNA polymerase V